MAVFSAHDLALHLARRVLDKDARDLVVLRLPEGHPLCDICLIATGRSERHVGALIDEAMHFVKRHKIGHQPVEGDTGWRVLDCNDVVVHVLTQELRDFYRLDRLWPDAEAIDAEAALAGLPDPDKRAT